MNIGIGPISGTYGGAAQHILNIIRHSAHNLNPISVPLLPRLQSWLYRRVLYPAVQASPSAYRHSRLRFDMYGWLRYCDVMGQLVARGIDRGSDVVHLHGHPYWNKFYSYNYRCSVYTVHNLYNLEDFASTWHRTVQMLTGQMVAFCKRSSTVISVARWLQEALAQKHGIQSVYIPNGVSMKEMQTGCAERFRKRYGVNDDFCLFVGRATKYKRPKLFVELARSLPYRQFVMIGRGLTKEGCASWLREVPPDNLVLLGEPPRQDVVDAFAACRVFVLTSANETFGIVLLEAMACGKPVVAANHLGPAEIVVNGETGFLFVPDDLVSLRQKTICAWEEALRIGISAKTVAAEQYDWKHIVPRIDDVYRRVNK